jgi:hypothetical protein
MKDKKSQKQITPSNPSHETTFKLLKKTHPVLPVSNEGKRMTEECTSPMDLRELHLPKGLLGPFLSQEKPNEMRNTVWYNIKTKQKML